MVSRAKSGAEFERDSARKGATLVLFHAARSEHADVDDLPDALREEFRACHDALTRERPLRGEDAVRATVRKMSNHEADEVACSVVRLFGAIAREFPGQNSHGLPEHAVNGVLANGAHGKGLKGVPPQVISLYAAEA